MDGGVFGLPDCGGQGSVTRVLSGALLAHFQGELSTIAFGCRIVLTKFQPRIVGVTNANPAVVATRWDHGLATGDVVQIVNVEGMTELNLNFYVVTVIDARSFSINVDSTAFGVYVKGSWYGSARRALGFTSHTDDVVIDNVRYKAASGMDATAAAGNADLALDNLEMQGLIDSDEITVADLETGVYSGAQYETFEFNYEDLTQGRLILRAGTLGELTRKDHVFVAEGLGLVNRLHHNVGQLVSVTCRAELGTRRQEPWYAIVGVNLAGNRFELANDQSRWFSQYDHIVVLYSTGNNGTYRVASVTVVGGGTGTRIVVDQTIPDATADGLLMRLPLDERFGCKVRVNPPEWLPATAYQAVAQYDAAVGSVVKPTTYNYRHYKCTTAGTSGAVEPAWNTDIGSTTADGSVVWTAVDALTHESAVSSVVDRRTFKDNATGLAVIPVNDWFTFGLFTWLSGSNKGRTSEVKSYLLTSYDIVSVNQGLKRFELAGDQTAWFGAGDQLSVIDSTGNDGIYTVASVSYDVPSARTRIIVNEAIPSATADGAISWRPATIVIRDAMPFAIEVGDRYEIEAGCNKIFETCQTKFDNVYNFRGEPWLPGFDKAMLYPDQK